MSQHQREDDHLAERIQAAYHANRGAYGSPRVHAELSERSKANALISLVRHSRAEARQAVFEDVETFYNRVRRHPSLEYVSPVAFEQQQL